MDFRCGGETPARQQAGRLRYKNPDYARNSYQF